MATLAAKTNRNVTIFSHDHDFKQLLSDNISIAFSRKSIIYELTVKTFVDEFEFQPGSYIDYLALKGDPSDNIKGIAGIGKVTAKKLIKEYDELEGIYSNISAMPDALSKKLLAGRNEVFNLRSFFTMDREVPVQISDISEIKFEDFINFGTSTLLQELGY